MQSKESAIASAVGSTLNAGKKRSLLKQNEAYITTRPNTVDDWLDSVDYAYLNDGEYKPTIFALKVVNFIKLVNEFNSGDDEDYTPNPVVHLIMLDKLVSKKEQIANLCARGLAKTTLMFEYLALYLAIFHHIDGFGSLDGMLYISDSLDNGVKSARQSLETRWTNSEFLKEQLPEAKFTDKYIEFTNKDGKKFGIKMYGASTGVRGTKIFGVRPKLAVMDDLISDDIAESETQMRKVRNVVNKGIKYALNRRQRKIIFNGTPFNKNDPMYSAIESGAWEVNVWPAAEKFPCRPEEFRSAWPEIFTYENMMADYKAGDNDNEVRIAFNQELMLRISSVDERLIKPKDKKWYSREKLLAQRHKYNFFMTTDFATKANEKNDYSVIMVWAVNSKNKWYLVDIMVKKQDMSKNILQVFKWVKKYNVLSVGVEISGQQGAFLDWIREQMQLRKEYFVLASAKGTTKEGIYPPANKFTRFMMVVPWFKADLFRFPIELRTSYEMLETMDELDNATIHGLKAKYDDCLDPISMLAYMNTWKPSDIGMNKTEEQENVSSREMWHNQIKALHNSNSPIDNYV